MTQTSLSQKKCIPCEGVEKPLDKAKASEYIQNIPGWQFDKEAKSISRTYRVKNFVTALKFFQDIGKIAEEENHHPD